MNVNEEVVVNTMLQLLDMTETKIKSEVTINRIIKNHFGFDACIILHVWKLMHDTFGNSLPNNLRVKHILWMFSYFKTYCEYEQYATRYKCSPVTFRTWVWYVARLVSQLEIVSSSI
jgi:hypothetical protein